jgi:hypothetical protein
MDVDGNRIQAHAGAFYYDEEQDIYYWYGENKAETDGKNKIWTSGIKYYSSKDFYNWKDEGFLIPPVTEDETSPLHPTQRLDRPHILYNDTTKKYVCWIKVSGEKACFLILTANSFCGPYELIKDNYRPLNKKVGDFDLAKDDKTGKAYLYFDSNHTGIVSIELTDDYMDVKQDFTMSYEGLHPPFCREGITHFMRKGKHYLFTSGMTGYIPNPSDSAETDGWMTQFKSIGNPHVNDTSSASFNSQIAAVFKHPKKKDLYLVLADRWVPQYVVTKEIYDILKRAIGSRFAPEQFQVTADERSVLMSSPMLASANTSIADYVLLPITWDGDKPTICWFDEWRIEDYE